MEIKINKEIPGYAIGQVIKVVTDKENIPLDYFWRRRLKDAVIDSCCEILKPASKQKAKSGMMKHSSTKGIGETEDIE